MAGQLSASEAKFLARLTSEVAAKTAEINAAMKAGDKSRLKSLMAQRKVIVDQRKAIEKKKSMSINTSSEGSAPAAAPTAGSAPAPGTVSAASAAQADDDDDDDEYEYDDDDDDE